MASSFLPPNYVPEFNPSISTIPIELYTRVITQKQQEYDQGVAAVQSYIHNVTGLEMGRDQDKAYYDSKVAEFKEQIKGTLTSDFSNKAVVMKAGSMSSKLYNDKRIRNSVMSRMYEKDFMEQLSKAQQDGTYAEENAALGLSQIKAWKEGDENATLGKMNYIAYDNYLPRLQEYMKSVHPDVRVDQNSPIGADGKPIPYILVEGKIQEITEGKVRDAMESFFSVDASARQQRSITAGYRGSQISDESALQNLRLIHQQNSKSIDDQISFFKQRKALVAGDKDKEKQYDDNIATLENNRTRLDENYQNELNMFATDPNSVKTNLWYRQQQQSIASTFAYNQTSQKYVDNPMFDVYKFGIEMDWEREKLRRQEEQNQLNRDNSLTIASMRGRGEGSAIPGIPAGMFPDATATVESVINGSTGDALRYYDEKVTSDLDAANQQLYALIYEGNKYERDGKVGSVGEDVIEKGPDGIYRLKDGVDNGRLMGYLGALKHAWQEGEIDPSNPNFNIVNKFFSATGDQYGEHFYRTAVKNAVEWKYVKENNLKNSKAYQENMAVAKRFEDAAIEAKAKGNTNDYNNLLQQANQYKAFALNKGYDEGVVGNYALERVNNSSLPALTVAKDTKDGGDTFKNLMAIAATKINTLPDFSSAEEGNKALNSTKGISIVYDHNKNEFTLHVQTIGKKIPPLPITEQQASLFGGASLKMSSEPYARVKEEIKRNGDKFSDYRVSRIGDFVVRTRIAYTGIGEEYVPMVEYKYKGAGNDDAQWQSLPNATRSVLSDLGSVFDFNRSIHGLNQDHLLLMLGQQGVDISQFSK